MLCRSYPGMADGACANLQTMTTSALLLILNSTRASDIPNILKGLGQEQQDHLMAYLYKVYPALSPFHGDVDNQGMAALGGSSEASGSVLLSWHEKVSPTIRVCEEELQLINS